MFIVEYQLAGLDTSEIRAFHIDSEAKKFKKDKEKKSSVKWANVIDVKGLMDTNKELNKIVVDLKYRRNCQIGDLKCRLKRSETRLHGIIKVFFLDK